MEPTAQQWKFARALAAAHGHEWAAHHTDGMTLADVARIASENCGPVGGICAPTIDGDGDIVHRTGTGRLGWMVFRDGDVTLTIYRPRGAILRDLERRGDRRLPAYLVDNDEAEVLQGIIVATDDVVRVDVLDGVPSRYEGDDSWERWPHEPRHVDTLADALAVVLRARGMSELDAHRAVRKALAAQVVQGTREYVTVEGVTPFVHWSAMTDDEDSAAIAAREAKRAAEWAAYEASPAA